MSYCLIPSLAQAFKQRLLDGTIDPAKLEKSTSQERRDFFAEFLGDHNARNVNALFESKMLLKNQQAGYVTWAKSVTGIKPELRRDMLSKIENLDKVLNPAQEKAFLNDLANKRLGLDVTYEEAQKITQGAKEIADLKTKIPVDSPIGSTERMEYGVKKALFQEYIKKLKTDSNALSFKEWLKSPGAMLKSLTATTKSLKASLDNSFFGRQGRNMLFTNPDIWTKAFVKSWGDIGKELMGHDAMLPIKADVYSRPHALDGKYKAGNYALDINSEEAFPTSAPEKVPILGRLFKAAESAYNGAALRIRADYADRIIDKADKFGVDTLDPKQAQGLGLLVNSLTGRGDIGKLNSIGEGVNASFFSIKYLKSNWDVLTAHRLGFEIPKGPVRSFVRRQAALNLTKIIAGTAAVIWTANQLQPGSTETDPHATNFGKIKIGNTTYDVTAGQGALVTLAARIIPQKINGRWGFYTKNSKGKLVELGAKDKNGNPVYGGRTAMDVIDDFFLGKLSPSAGFFRDMWKGTDYQGNDTSPSGLMKNPVPTLKNLSEPLPLQTFETLQKAQNANELATMILEELGINTNTQIKK